MSPTVTAALYLFLAILTAWVAWHIRINRTIKGADALHRALHGLSARARRPLATLLVRAGLATLAAVWAYNAVMAVAVGSGWL